MICIGIDPGLTGAVGRLNNGRFEGVLDIPTVTKGTGSVKREVDPAGVAHILRTASSGSGEFVAVVLERVNAMPGQGVSSVFSLGDSFGSLRAVVAVLGIEMHYVSPVTWKKHFGLGSDKELSRALAVKLFPQAELHLKKHADRAEALLMARWLHETRYA
jgi:crossover junction endodeoxyribonuclease RuvC